MTCSAALVYQMVPFAFLGYSLVCTQLPARQVEHAYSYQQYRMLTTLLPAESSCSILPSSIMLQVSKPLWGWSGNPAVARCAGAFSSSSMRYGSRLRKAGVPTERQIGMPAPSETCVPRTTCIKGSFLGKPDTPRYSAAEGDRCSYGNLNGQCKLTEGGQQQHESSSPAEPVVDQSRLP